MADLHIVRDHALSIAAARKVARTWVEQAQSEFGMECAYADGKTEDTVTFSRSGVNGTMQVNKDRFVLEAKLGFLLGAFKDRIESEIVKNLDAMLVPAVKSKKASGK